MDEEVRRAQRLVQRIHGFHENAILEQYVQQVYDYANAQGLKINHIGVAHNICDIRRKTLNIGVFQKIASRSISFLQRFDLDELDHLTMRDYICASTGWQDWFCVIAYYQVFVKKQKDGTGFWSRLLAEKETRQPSYYYALQKTMDEWPNYMLTCLLRPKYTPPGTLEDWNDGGKCYLWSAELSLLGYETSTDAESVNK